MKKLLLLAFISFVTFIPQLHSISLAAYIQQYGMPQIDARLLDLSNNNLTDLTGLQDIPNINQVTSLDLSLNQLQALPDNIFNGLQCLEWLLLNNNQLQTLPDNIFNGLQNLRMLELHYNQLQTLPANIFNGLQNLKQLYLDNNRLQTLPDNIFNGLQSLSILSLNNNQLQTLPDTIFSNLKRLPTLNLKGNPFTPDFIPTLNNIIRDIPNLQFLNEKDKNQALKEQPFVTLIRSTAENIAKNIGAYRPILHKLPSDVLDLLPLTEQERQEIEQRRAGQ